jgi:type I restriction enzyme M protein
MQNQNPQYISTSDLANILGVTRQAIQKRFKNEPNIKTIQVGSSFLYVVDTLPEDIKERIRKSQKEAAENVIKKSKEKKGSVDLKKELWTAADKLRGNVDPSDYKHIVLGLIFLKYVSDAFYQTKKKNEFQVSDVSSPYYLENEEARKFYLEQKDPYLKEGVFYVPEKARWDYLLQNSSQPNFGRLLDEAMEALEEENPQLKGILPKEYSRVLIDNHVLVELVNLFSKINFYDFEKEKDLLGEVYEYFLGQFADSEGKRGGEFFTPQSIVKLLVEILEPFEGARIFDPACGSGGMFVKSGEYLKNHLKDKNKISFYGQELNQTTWKLCKMNLALRGYTGIIEQGNSYYDDKFLNMRFDFVLSNPPFNAEWEPKRLSSSDPRLKYGIPPSSNANFLWIQHFIYHLAPNGMAGFVMANGALAVGGKEGEIRKKIVEDDLVDVIIACPPKLFFNVSLPVSLWFITKNKADGRFRSRKGETLFIDAREIFTQISRKQVEFSQEQIEKIAKTVRAWRGEEGAGEYKDIPGYCKSATLDEIRKNDYVLTPGRYVGVKEEEDDGVPFEEKMRKLTADLEEFFKQGKELEEKIRENLKTVMTI